MMMWILLLNIILIALFLIVYLTDPRRQINGLLFIISAVTLSGTASYYALLSSNPILSFIVRALLVVFSILLALSSLLLIIACFGNFIVLIKREGLKPKNLLVLLLGIFLLVTSIIGILTEKNIIKGDAGFFISYANMVTFYFELVSVIFLISSLLCTLYRPRYNKDYIIVLGSGLINGERVSKLLSNRIDKAIDFYTRQKKKNGVAPKLIMSGGRGLDEQISEALAMQIYALGKEVPSEDILLEERSTNTYENMKYSKELILKRQAGAPYKALYSTNNFHLFRAGLLAKKQQLHAFGISAKTAFYYWPNATIREFIATLVMHKGWHISVCIFLALFTLLLWLINKYFVIK